MKAAHDDPSLAPAALDVLRRIAADDAASITDEMEAQFGMEPGRLRGPNTKFYVVRDYAFRAIGKLGIPDAIAYLEGVQGSDFEGDDRRLIWPAALEALQGARLEQIPSRQDQAQFLEATIHEYHDVDEIGILADWAAEQLCNRGMLSSYVVAEQLFMERSRRTGPKKARFCELRMRALAADPDRFRAIAAILQVGEGVADPQLTQWAIEELTNMKSPRADEVMETFEQQILALPEGPQKRELMPYADAVYYRKGQPPPRK